MKKITVVSYDESLLDSLSEKFYKNNSKFAQAYKDLFNLKKYGENPKFVYCETLNGNVLFVPQKIVDSVYSNLSELNWNVIKHLTQESFSKDDEFIFNEIFVTAKDWKSYTDFKTVFTNALTTDWIKYT